MARAEAPHAPLLGSAQTAVFNVGRICSHDPPQSLPIDLLPHSIAEAVKVNIKEALRGLPTRADFDGYVSRMEGTIKRELATLQGSVIEVTARVDGVESSHRALVTQVAELEQQQNQSRRLLSDLFLAHDDVENRNRRNNLRLRGVPESVETRDLSTAVISIFNELLDLPSANHIELDRVHRALGPRPRDPNRPRDIICRVRFFKIKEDLLRRAWEKGPIQYKGAEVILLQDLSRRTLQMRKLLKPLLEAVQRQGASYRWGHPFQLLVLRGGGLFVLGSPGQLPDLFYFLEVDNVDVPDWTVPDLTIYNRQLLQRPRGGPGGDGGRMRGRRSYRPISLLNADLKLYAKILANRLAPVVSQVVHLDQTGFVLAREARDNVVRALNAIHKAQAYDTPMMLLSTDAEKAFDRQMLMAIIQQGTKEGSRQPSGSLDLQAEVEEGEEKEIRPQEVDLEMETTNLSVEGIGEEARDDDDDDSHHDVGGDDGGEAYLELVETMNMQCYGTSKLTLKDILSIGTENLREDQSVTVEHLPLVYLRKLMALNRTARESLVNDGQPTHDISFNIDQPLDDNDPSEIGQPLDDNDPFNIGQNTDNDYLQDENDVSALINPHDVLCVLLHCSDSLLQQEIVAKMAMCQFAVPLLLPAGDGSHCTFMLWAMRDIVKKWRPQSSVDSKGFKEENVVNVIMPIFSFVKMGGKKLSKSNILNQVLNPAQLNNNFFIHDDMEGGNIKRKISDGLVEMSWYFPCGKSDVFPEPIAVTNLRGDVESHWDQFTFLTRISSAVFIFIESISEKEFKLISQCSNSDTQYYFIVTPGSGKNVTLQTKGILKKLQPILKLKKQNVIVHAGNTNKATFVKKLQSSIVSLLNNDLKKMTMTNLQEETNGLHIHVDENIPECQRARELAREITREITDVAKYKNKTMILQGDLWKELSKVEKEICRMTNQQGKDIQHYQQELRDIRVSLHEKQHQHDLPRGIMLFIDSITNSSQTEKQYFLKWLKFELDGIARSHLSKLQAEYKEKCKDKENNKDALLQIDQKLSDSSLGIEHFIREMGQFYEAECSMLNKSKITESQQKCNRLPGIAADLLLDGFPLELIDGDASNIPLRWLTDVLNELNTKTGKECKIRVITVLGVQSTGKSTLLNTMFGLQFPVASGRCTRGAFMTLLKIKEDFRNELGCQFIMVIDTEGLKAPELASLEGSYEHDNELATLVVGLSDVTIVNMAMENTTEMKDILQIVVHAFLRMKEIGKKPSCQFVHQNVSDVSAYEKNMRDRKKLLEQLNEMTSVAAKMEMKSGITMFSDVMDYDLEKDNWYIPGLWLGVPPMASVNSGYSEHVHELKKYVLKSMKKKNSLYGSSTIPDFITWIESLWNAVKHEKFIFSFRNSLVAEAYNKLSMEYSQWEWDFRKAVYDWLITTETTIKNQSSESLNADLNLRFMNDLGNVLSTEKNKMMTLLEKYFESKNANVHLIEQYKEDFALNIKSLNNELQRTAHTKCNEAVSIQKGKFKIQKIQSSSQKLIEDKITDLLTMCRKKKKKLSEEELNMEFETMWDETLRELQIEKLETCIVSKYMLQLLNNDMSSKGSGVNEDLQRVKDLEDGMQSDFKVKEKYIESGWFKNLIKKIGYGNSRPYEKLQTFTVSLIAKCKSYVTEKVKSEEDYNDTYGRELLHMINSELKQKESLHFTSLFELDLKHHILGKASQEFQKMHNKYIKENDPKRSLEKLKPTYVATFINTFQDKDLCQDKAKELCERCLKPAITDYVFKHLGQAMMDDIANSSDNITFNSRMIFQSVLLKELLEKKNFKTFLRYIRSYEEYTKAWILNYIKKKYRNSQTLKPLLENKISFINKHVGEVLANVECLQSASVSVFLLRVCEMLNTKLVIPQNEMQAVNFQNKASIELFSSNILLFLPDTEAQILSALQDMNIESLLDKVTVKPQNELFRNVVGCGEQCPFCKVPCEAGGEEHKEHFATIHRPSGLGRERWHTDETLVTDICSTAVVSDDSFETSVTEGKFHPYKDYRHYYPNWKIQPDSSIEASDYWKYVFVKYNEQFAKAYKANPAKLPEGWKNITEENALQNIKKVFNIK
ncbi:interferon-induced very large GTPase 1-like [Gastrophryne carolinensis]